MLDFQPMCVICGQVLNMKRDNYGWHRSPNGGVERCAYNVLPMKITSKPFKFKTPKYTRVILVK